MQIPNSSSRDYGLDLARLFAILMVVYFHGVQYVDRYELSGLSLEVQSLLLFYLGAVEVPVFSLVAGIVFAQHGRLVTGVRSFAKLVASKVNRLIIPFAVVSVLQFTIKAVAWKQADYSELLVMFIAPKAGPAPHLWYLYVLFSIFVLAI